jgi:AcrR family transcriptional regulator
MARPQIYSADAILDSARTLVLDAGARAATVNAIAAASGAPKGSIYHRFRSLDELLAAMWIRAVRRSQAMFLAALEHPDPTTAAVDAALALHDFARDERADARLLASLRPEDLMARVELADVNRPVRDALTTLARRLFGATTREAIERTTCAVVDLPIGATRRHLIAGSPLPRTLRPQLAAAVRAALEAGGGALP